MDTKSAIRRYYACRGYKVPTRLEALGFVVTELGEAFDVALEQVGGWKRNNPDAKTAQEAAFVEEVGDIIMMLFVAVGLDDDSGDPIAALMDKMKRKCEDVVNN